MLQNLTAQRVSFTLSQGPVQQKGAQMLQRVGSGRMMRLCKELEEQEPLPELSSFPLLLQSLHLAPHEACPPLS